MARCPFASWNPAGATPGGTIDPRVVIFHVTAGLGNARPHSNLEWHFEVSLSGDLEQQVDTNQRADANNKANGFAISIETEGKGDGWWTDAQLDTLVRLSEWCLATHPRIARRRCDRWDGSGFGYHVMWGAPGPWTPVAKSCPGPNRIRQFDDVLLPRILQGDDMPTADEVAAAVVDRLNREGTAYGLTTCGQTIVEAVNLGRANFNAVTAIAKAIKDVDGVDEKALAAEIVLAVQGVLNGLPDAELEKIPAMVADELDRRQRERLGAG